MTTFSIAFCYIRRHIVKFILMIVACAGIISTQVFADIFYNAQNFAKFIEANSDTIPIKWVLFDVNPSLINDGVLSDFHAGLQNIVSVYEQGEQKYYIACMDKKALNACGAEIVRGELPKNDSEIAAQYSILSALGADVGDKVELFVTDKDGSHKKTYTVSGMTNDYYDKYNSTSFLYPSDSEEKDYSLITFPAIITGQSDKYLSQNMVVGIEDFFYYPEQHIMMFEQKAALFNTDALAPDQLFNDTEDSVPGFIVSVVMPAFIIIAMFAGVYICVRILADGQKKNLRQIFVIGATKKQIMSVYMWEALFISLSSCILSVFFGTCFGASYNLFITESNFYYSIDLPRVLIVAAISFSAMIVFYLFYFRVLTDNERGKKHNAYSNTKSGLFRLWSKTTGKHPFLLNASYSLTVITLIAVFSCGMFFGDLMLMNSRNEIQENEKYSSDYYATVTSGSVKDEAFMYDLPADNGLLPDELKYIKEKYGLRMDFYGMRYNPHPYAIVEKGNNTPKGLANGQNVYLSAEYKELLSKAGVENCGKLIKYPVFAVPYEYLNVLTGNNDISKEDFESGKRIISVNGDFEKNDSISFGFMFYPKNILSFTDEQIAENPPEIVTADFTVTDVITLDNNFDDIIIQDFAKGSYLLTSDKYLMSLSDKFRYDFIAMSSETEKSVADEKELDKELSSLCKSNNIYLFNFAVMKAILQDKAISQKMPFVIISLLYMMILALFTYICINCEVKNKIKSIAVLRALGIKPIRLFGIILYNAIKKSVLPIIIGSAGTVAVCFAATPVLFPTEFFPDIPYSNLVPYLAVSISIVLLVNIVSCTTTCISSVRKQIYKTLTSDSD